MGLLGRFGGTLFLSAALLFCVEPMVAKMLTPLLGGAPAVWITCIVFFQAALLAGYAFAHATVAKLGVRRQAMLQIAVVFLPLAVLPIRIRESAASALDGSRAPALELLVVLMTSVGLPFFVLSTTAPLLQKWFSRLGHPSGEDPYFLYGASNLGSLLALAAYPALIEPRLGLSSQSGFWMWGYGALALMVTTCAIPVIRATSASASTPTPTSTPTSTIAGMRRLRWVALSFVPSSFLLGITTYITTDLAPIPLFWVIPLAVYLLTFILVFAKKPPIPHRWMVRILPFAVTATVLMLLVGATQPVLLIVPPHLCTFFIACMVCHGELAADRPPPEHLTEFYLWVSVGGVLGGLFNGIVAPALFSSVVEYPLVMVLASLCRRVPRAKEAKEDDPRARRLDVLLPAGIGVVTLALVLGGRAFGFDPTGNAFTLLLGVPLLVNYGFLERPLRFGLGIGACLLAGSVAATEGRTLDVERNFFGIVRVSEDPSGRFTEIVHGNTVHGRQSRDPALRRTPFGYYTRTGPLGQVFEAFRSSIAAAPRSGVSEGRRPRVAIIGLGSGGMAPYAEPGDDWTFYELNPAMVRIAEDPRLFTYLSDAFPDPSRLHVVLGDARLRLHDAPDGYYDLLVLDAFSSDSIPAHLLTREALALYRVKVRPDAIIVAHISNRYLNLGPVFGALARDAGLSIRGREDTHLEKADLDAGKMGSVWVALAANDADLGPLVGDARWVTVRRDFSQVWSDDFSNLFAVFRW
jgi:hypothetical protein